jgi:carbon starvation protein CstA
MLHRVKTFIFLFNFYTLLVWAWLMIEFLTKEQFKLPTLLPTLYCTIVASYVGDKELQRKRKHFTSRRLHGELFVVLWVISLIIITSVVTFGGDSNGYRIPPDLPIVTGTVLILYILTEYLKQESKKNLSAKSSRH